MSSKPKRIKKRVPSFSSNTKKKWDSMATKINYNTYTFLVFLLGNFVVLFTMISFAPPFWFYNPWWGALYFFLVLLPRSCVLLFLYNKFPSPPFQKMFGILVLFLPFFLSIESSVIARVMLNLVVILDTWWWMRSFGTLSI